MCHKVSLKSEKRFEILHVMEGKRVNQSHLPLHHMRSKSSLIHTKSLNFTFGKNDVEIFLCHKKLMTFLVYYFKPSVISTSNPPFPPQATCWIRLPVQPCGSRGSTTFTVRATAWAASSTSTRGPAASATRPSLMNLWRPA